MGVLREEDERLPDVIQPRSLHEAWERKMALGDSARYVAGGTLLRTGWENGTALMPKQLIDLRQISGLADITLTEFHLSLGALVPLSECRSNEYLGAVAPALQEAVRCIAAPSVRNLATIGGNIASGFGDILPALLVYEAELISYDGKFMTGLPLIEWLNNHWSGMKAASDLVAGIRLSPARLENPLTDRLEIFHKVGRREAFTPSLVTVAISASIDTEHRFHEVRIVAGGGSGRPQRLSRAEAMLEDLVYTEALLPALYEVVEDSFDTYSDPFATDLYKKKTAGNLVVSELWKAMNIRS
ncbi:FAD binding domain-containing protein [Paenibacillus sp. FSL R10-2734]|uniref:FAD binding domain-containing protein n=1 Tax=Paenibacillus sp. FSL R10-2734 TaxID=2954691 RepID=UPI0030DCA139